MAKALQFLVVPPGEAKYIVFVCIDLLFNRKRVNLPVQVVLFSPLPHSVIPSVQVLSFSCLVDFLTQY